MTENKTSFQLGDIGQDEERHVHRDLPRNIPKKGNFLLVEDLRKRAFWAKVKESWAPVKIAAKNGNLMTAHGFSFYTVAGVKLHGANENAFLVDYALSLNKDDSMVSKLIPAFRQMLPQKGYRIRAFNGRITEKKRKEMEEKKRKRSEVAKKAANKRLGVRSETEQIDFVSRFRELGDISYVEGGKILGVQPEALRRWNLKFGGEKRPQGGTLKVRLKAVGKEEILIPTKFLHEASLVERAKAQALEEFEEEKIAFLEAVKVEKERLWKEFRGEDA